MTFYDVPPLAGLGVGAYALELAVLAGGGLLVGFVLRWWGLVLTLGGAVFLVYAWEFDSSGVAYAAIAAALASAAVIGGALLRGRRSARQ